MPTNKLINFLNHNLNPKISYNCVPDDLYKPENLISSSQGSLNLGFMAYSVVKPPVDLIFNLSHKIDIHVIKLWLKFNSNVQTTGVELYTKFNSEFIRIGVYDSCLNTKNNCEGCLFFRSDAPNDYHFMTNLESLKFEKSYSLRSTNQIKVVLKHTNRSCVPVLKKIELWGLPSRECSKEEVCSINRIWNKVDTLHTHIYEYNSNVDLNNGQNEEIKKNSDELKIPEEFLDSITYEIMTIPMALPSGKLVDQITIERHTAIEITNGRDPSDPFTGLPFTSLRKPVYDHALKLQIDEFLIKHQNEYEVKNMPRTIGKKRMRDNIESMYSSNQISLNTLTTVSSLSTVDLDILVSHAVNNIKKPRVYEEKIVDKCCSDCNIEYNNDIIMYKISQCNHIICRNCLMKNKSTNKVCKLCSIDYTNYDLIKLNL